MQAILDQHDRNVGLLGQLLREQLGAAAHHESTPTQATWWKAAREVPFAPYLLTD